MAASVFGRMWRMMMRRRLAPMARAAHYSPASPPTRRPSRVRRAGTSQSTNDNAIRTPEQSRGELVDARDPASNPRF